MGWLVHGWFATLLATTPVPPGAARPPDPRPPEMGQPPGRPPGPPPGEMGRPPEARPPEMDRASCLLGPETREAVQSRRVVPPFRAVAEAMRQGGELVGIRLCSAAGGRLVYDVAVLRRDGRLVHVMIDGATGTPLPGRRQN